MAGGLGAVIPGGADTSLDPVGGLTSASDPLTASGSPTMQSIHDRLRMGDVDPLNIMVNRMSQASKNLETLTPQLATAGQAQQTSQDAYMKWLQSQYSPERESQLNWQAIGNMGAGLMTGDWAQGAKNYQEARNQNQQTLDKANQALNEGTMLMGDKRYGNIMDQYKMNQSELKDIMKEYGTLAKDALKEKAPKMVTSQTGEVYEWDPATDKKTLVLSSNGLTPQDGQALGDYYKMLQSSPIAGDQAKVVELYNKEMARRVALNKASLGQVSALTPIAESEQIPMNAKPQGVDELAAVREVQKAKGDLALQMGADGKTTDVTPLDGQGLWTQNELTGPNAKPPQTTDPVELDAWKQSQLKYNEEAMKDETAARTNLMQTQAMYDSSKAAMAMGAKTGAIQPFMNGFGLVMQSLGLQGGLAAEAIKGKAFDSVVNQAVQVLQNAAKGVQTEGDAKRFAASLVQVKNPEQANQLIVKFMEAQLWKRQQEITFRGTYSATNPSAAGASSKWSEWSSGVPAIQQINTKPVFVQDYIKNYVNSNPEAVQLKGADYVQREAVKAWRNRAR